MAQAISNLITPAQSALNSRLGAGLSIGSNGSLQGYTPTSNAATANLLLGPLASKTPVPAAAPSLNTISSPAPTGQTATSGALYTPATSTAGLYPPGTPQNGGNITQVNDTGQPNLPVTPSTGNFTTPSGATVNSNGGLVQAASQTAPGLLSQLTGVAGQNATIGQNAADIASNYGKQIADIGQRGAQAQAGYTTTGTTPVAEGNAAVIAQSTAAQQQALAAGESAALQGTGQQLTANNQQQTGINQALNAATDLTQAPYGTPLYNAATGTFTNAQTGQGVDFNTAMQSYAQGLASGTIPFSQIPSQITSNPVLLAQLLQQASTAQSGSGSSFNLNANLGTTAAQQQIAQQIPAWTAANTAAKGIQQTVSSYLAANPQLNSSDLAASNALNQWINGQQLTDPKYQTLFNLLNEYTSTLAPVLGVGGDTTNLKTEIAQSFINAKASGASIQEVLNNIAQVADSKIANYQSGGTGGGVVSSGLNGGGSNGLPVPVSQMSF